MPSSFGPWAHPPDRATRTSDVMKLVMDNFIVDQVFVEEVTGELGILRIFVPGITKAMQIDIHDFMIDKIPMGIKLDVHRTEPPDPLKGATFKSKKPMPKRDPKWT